MSKKQGKSKKNVFGLVSKIGSLIKKGGNNSNNPENNDGTGENETPKKNFNIHISEDNLDVFAIGDEEEEEEEDEEEKEVKDKNEKKDDENKEKQNKEKENENKENKEKGNDEKEEKKENEENKNDKEISNKDNKENKEEENNKSKEKIKNIDNENNNNDNIKKDDEEKKNVKNDINPNSNSNEDNKENIDTNKINNINEDNKIIEKENIKEVEKINKEIKIIDSRETCHLCLKKGNDFNSSEIYCYPITKNKKRKSVFQKVGLFTKPKYDLLNYKIFFDECFIYFSRDIILDKKNTSKRRINNVLKIKNIINYTNTKENNEYHIVLEIINKNGIKKNKEFTIDEKYLEAFNNEINNGLQLYGALYTKNK